MKQKRSKYAWMMALMISSQILLSGFMAYWLISQYQKEQGELHSKLKKEYFNIHEQLIDSVLLRDLITPTLNDSVIISLNVSSDRMIEVLDDSSQHDILIKHFHTDSLPEEQVFALHLGDEISYDSMMVRSVKLFINQTDESFRTNPGAHVFSMQIDSTAFQLELDKQFRSLGWEFLLEPMDRNISDAEMKTLSGLALISGPKALPRFFVKKYTGYLLSSMFPQFLFALILLSLSASALLIVYRSLRKQTALNELRDDFISNISHELKTPVSTVKVALEALSRFDLKKDPRVTGEYLDLASRELERLEGLVGKVLDHQVLESPSSMLRKESCDLNSVVQKLIRTLEISIREVGADVSISEAEGSCEVMADPVYLEGVIINLIDNSLKYAGPSPEIHIDLACNLTGVTISVRDKGPGIPEEFKSRIFDKFFRIPAGNRHNVKGYGLGLNFASQVMAQHGGSISVRNLPERGCEFTLLFPNPGI